MVDQGPERDCMPDEKDDAIVHYADKNRLTCQLSGPNLGYEGYFVDARLILVVEQVVVGKAGDVQHEV